MGKNIAFKVENISKAYQLGQIGTGTISRDVERFFITKILKKEDPFLKIGQTNDRTVKGESDIVWSLKDINFEIERGDAVGIIGRNGAGKSTLLKLLSRVTAPTTGNIKVKGRIASLLEVGTGFHPELSGRENIFLNGAILGMRKAEIKRKFDEIVDFAGVERYIDTPVKRYSSGMYVRLAFAVAAHLESEILIVDEVLSVGDAEFQKKCLGKMSDVSKGDGRTILFVSHNMAAVASLCNKGILLNQGQVNFKGSQSETIQFYLNNTNIVKNNYFNTELNKIENTTIKINSFIVQSLIEGEISISSGFKFTLIFEYFEYNKNLAVNFELQNIEEIVVFFHATWVFNNNDSKNGKYKLEGLVSPNILNAGEYKFNLIFGESKSKSILRKNEIVQFEVSNESLAGVFDKFPGIIRPEIKYNFSRIDD
jgi:lipopolysaccharide transport system ATP-binding protein